MSSNPKDIIGRTKPPLDLIPGVAMVQLSLALKEGAGKYGKANWRQETISASAYVAAAMRHLAAWNDGEDDDPQSLVSHIAHMMACGAILLDAQAIGKLEDDRVQGGAAAAIRKFTTK
jgi:hypothetical protein